MFEFLGDVSAIEGAVDELISNSANPQGYPINKITVYHKEYKEGNTVPITCFEFITRCCSLEILNPDTLPSQVTLDFRKAGRILKDKTNLVKNQLNNGQYTLKDGEYCFECGIKIPSSFVTSKELFDKADKPTIKTIGTRRALVKIDISITEETKEMWEAIKFKKYVKEQVTEIDKINILPAIFGGTENEPFQPFVDINVIESRWLDNMKEKTFQSLEKYGERVFYNSPLRLNLPTRDELYHILKAQDL